MSLTTRIPLGFDTLYALARDLSIPVDKLALNRAIELADGDGADEADVIFHDSRSLADAGEETLDFNGGSLTDPLGNPLTMAKLKVLYLKNTSTEATLLIGGAATTPVGLFADPADVLKLPPGGVFLFTAPDVNGLAVSTNKNLKLAHDGTGTSALVYEIIAIGVD